MIFGMHTILYSENTHAVIESTILTSPAIYLRVRSPACVFPSSC